MAAMALYTDKVDNLPSGPDITEDVKLYLHNEGDIPDKDKDGNLKIRVKIDTEKTWWAEYKLDDADNDRVRDKLNGRAKSANLKGTTGDTPPTKLSSGEYPQYQYDSSTKHNYVWLLIRSSKKK